MSEKELGGCEHEACNILSEEFLRCKLWAGEAIKDIMNKVEHAHTRIDDLEAGHASLRASQDRVEKKLDTAEGQRLKFSDYVADQLRQIHTIISNLASADNDKHAQMHEAIIGLTEQVARIAEVTDVNSNYITKQEAEQEFKLKLEAEMEKINKPRRELRQKVITAVVITMTLGTLGLIGTGILFIYDLYSKLNP